MQGHIVELPRPDVQMASPQQPTWECHTCVGDWCSQRSSPAAYLLL